MANYTPNFKPRRNVGISGIDGEMIDSGNVEIQNALARMISQPMNTIRASSGEYLTPQGERSATPVEFGQSVHRPQFQGSPVDVFGQGRGFMQPDGTIVGVNQQGQRFRVQPEGTEASQQAARDAALKRRMLMAQVQQEEAKLGQSGLSPSDQLAREKFEWEKSQSTASPKLTEAQAKATTFASQMAAASNELDKLEQSGFDPNSTASQIQTGMAGGIGNVFTSPQAQQAKQTQNQWSEAFLRVKTGAAATLPEVELNNKTFFPQLGDSKEVIEQKRRMRVQAERDVLNMTGGGREMATQRNTPEMAISGAPKTGHMQDGYVFLGGDPADPKRWRKQ